MNAMSDVETEQSAPVSSAQIVEITEAALAKLLELRADEADGDDLGLRLEIASSPGEDFRYDLSFDEYLTAAFTDEVRTHGALKVVVPQRDLEQLTGATLDFTETQGLVIRNPNRPSAPNVEGLVSDDELSQRIVPVIADEVNPALAAHGGFVSYVGHDPEGVVYLTMGGGCHGCSMSKMTMLDGVQTMLVEAVPEVTAVRDLTDHTSGANPYYS